MPIYFAVGLKCHVDDAFVYWRQTEAKIASAYSEKRLIAGSIIAKI